jgi:hypothetical protein
MTAHIYLALICQIALTQGAVSAETTACSVDGDSKCSQSEPGSSDDAQVLLQSQKMDVSQHSELDNEGHAAPTGFNFQVRPHDYELSMTMTSVVKINDKMRGDGDLIAFVGGKVQGLSTAQKVPDDFPPPFAGMEMYHQMIYGHGSAPGSTPDAGKGLTFKWLSHDGTLMDLDVLGDAITFTSDGNLGNATAPMVLIPAAPAMLLQVPGNNSKFSFKLNPYLYENSMTLDCVVKIDGKLRADGDLAAFVGGKLQGVGHAKVFPPTGDSVYGTMVHGHGSAPGTTPDDGKALTFMWLSHDGDLIKLEPVAAPQAETFQANGHVGNAENPVVLTPVAGAAPPPQECKDATQEEMDAFIENTFGFKFDGVLCSWVAHSWKQCSTFPGMCDKTCGECA